MRCMRSAPVVKGRRTDGLYSGYILELRPYMEKRDVLVAPRMIILVDGGAGLGALGAVVLGVLMASG
jgi:hypothetical protein